MKRSLVLLTTSLLLTAACATKNASMTDSTMAGSSSSTMAMSSQSIAEIAMSTGMHTTLVAALKSAGLADMLMASGNYTVFAPTDEAFAKLPAGTVDMLMRPENRDKLRALLQYHVVPGRVSAAQVMKMKSAKTVSGKNVAIMMMGDQVMIGNAHVVKADIQASNGVVHVIDTVLMPPGM